jgi:hypothetical protein
VPMPSPARTLCCWDSFTVKQFIVIASEAKQSTYPLVEPWIASSLRSSQ